MNKRVAIVYDWIDKWGGVERVLLGFHEIFRQADFFTSYHNKNEADWAKDLKIKTSFIQRLPSFLRKSRVFSFPFYPFAFESFDFSGYDLVISVTSSFAKGVITKTGTKHICYLLTPTRYFWLYPELYIKKTLFAPLVFSYINKMKQWDYAAAQRPDEIISISQTVAGRCRKYYHRESKVIYPPFDIGYWGKIKAEILNSSWQTNSKFKILNSTPYYLIVSRLEPYKRVDIAIDVFNKNGKKLAVIGEGGQAKKLKKKAGANIYFFSKLSDQELGWLYTNAQALIMPQEEDFGYSALEAQFFQCPVVAYKRGGATETVIEGKTGIFFDRQSPKALIAALERYIKIAYNLKYQLKKTTENNIKKFDRKKFEDAFIKIIK